MSQNGSSKLYFWFFKIFKHACKRMFETHTHTTFACFTVFVLSASCVLCSLCQNLELGSKFLALTASTRLDTTGHLVSASRLPPCHRYLPHCYPDSPKTTAIEAWAIQNKTYSKWSKKLLCIPCWHACCAKHSLCSLLLESGQDDEGLCFQNLDTEGHYRSCLQHLRNSGLLDSNHKKMFAPPRF